jgi:hypothetical protein
MTEIILIDEVFANLCSHIVKINIAITDGITAGLPTNTDRPSPFRPMLPACTGNPP